MSSGTAAQAISTIDEWVFQEGDHVESDVLFVFGTPHHVAEFASRIHSVYAAHRLRRVIVSGHGGEAEALALAAHRRGVPVEAFELERAAANTWENVAFSEALLRNACVNGQLHVLAKRYAGPRSLLSLQLRFSQWKFQLHAVDWFGVEPSTWRHHDEFRRKVVQELVKTADYAERGDIALPSEPWKPDCLRSTAAALAADPPSARAQVLRQAQDPRRWAEVTESKQQDVGDMTLVTLEAQLSDADGQSVLRTTIVKRPDAVGIVAYDDQRDVVVLVEQFRAGPYAASGMQTMVEIVAGYADPGESTQEAARRELEEETGLVADRLIHIATYFPAPTLSTEQMSLWCGLVDSRTALERTATGAERIRVICLSGEQAAALVVDNQVSNALTLTALQWLVQGRALLLGTRRREDVR